MDPMEAESLLRKLDRRLQNVEQILPSLATRDDLAKVVTHEQLDAAVATLATKADLEAAIAPLATKAELAAATAPLATKTELAAAIAPLATKAEVSAQFRAEGERARKHLEDRLAAAIAPLATKAEMREEGERTRRHMDVVAESLRDDIRLIAESHLALETKVDRHRRDADAGLKNHAERITRLEALTARGRRQKGR